MREHPILFSGPMVRAILDGPKTVTRRPVKSLLGFGEITEFQPSDTPGYAWTFRNGRMLWNDLRHTELMAACPYGQPGDRLWVRETWAIRGNEDGHPIDASGDLADVRNAERLYRADTRPGPYGSDLLLDGAEYYGAWTPSIHIPRWACRLVLENTAVSVALLEDITDAQARAEGFESREAFLAAYRAMYRLAPDANPWVWVIEFKRTEASA